MCFILDCRDLLRSSKRRTPCTRVRLPSPMKVSCWLFCPSSLPSVVMLFSSSLAYEPFFIFKLCLNMKFAVCNFGYFLFRCMMMKTVGMYFAGSVEFECICMSLQFCSIFISINRNRVQILSRLWLGEI